MVTNPSIVIGVGEAGCKMATRAYESITEEVSRTDSEAAEEVLDRFKFVGIDTKADEVEAHTADNFETIALDPPHQFWEEDRENYPYLRDDMELADVGGATRQRAVSRYYIDNLQNYERFYRRLEQIVQDFEDQEGQRIDGQEIAAANVWVINSFGGGTGSGAFPILSAMLDQITRDADEDYYLCGIGSLPRLDGLDESTPPPDANVSFYANAYAALRELAVLVDYDFDGQFADAAGVEYPVTIPVYAARKEDKLPGFGDLQLSNPPFDFYGVVGFDEEEANENSNYREDLNQVAADLVRLFSETFEEDFPNAYTRDRGGKPVLYSVDSRGVEVPVEKVESYIQALEDIDEIESRIEDANDELERYRENRDYLNELRDVDPGADPGDRGEEEDGGTSRVDPSFINAAQEHAEAFDPRDGFNTDLLDEHFEDVLAETGTVSEQYEFDTQDVIAYLYYQELVHALQQSKDRHQFVTLLEDAIDDYASKFDLYLGTEEIETLHSEGDPLEKWTGALEEFFEEAIDDQKQKLENTSKLKIRKRGELKRRIESLQSRSADLTDEYIEYKNLDDAQSTARGRRQEARTRLEDVRSTVNDRISDVEDELDDLNAERGRRLNVQKSRKETLSSYERERYVNIPFQDFENASVEFLRDLDNVGDLLEKRIVTRRKLARAFEYQIDHLEEPTQDLETYNIQTTPYRYLGLLVSEDNVDLVEGELDDLEEITNVSSMLANNSDEQDRALVEDAFRIRMTAAHADVALENTSEFGQIHSYYSDENRDVGELLGSSSNDTELVAEKFGYPELFPEDERVRGVFELDARQETADD